MEQLAFDINAILDVAMKITEKSCRNNKWAKRKHCYEIIRDNIQVTEKDELVQNSSAYYTITP